MRRVPRILRAIALGLAAIAAAGVALALFAIATPSGGHLVVSIVNSRDVPVRIGSFNGVLARTFTLYGVDVRTGVLTATADTVRVSWRPASLWRHHLELTRIDIAGAHVTIASSLPDSTAASQARAEAPESQRWTITATHVAARRVDVEAPDSIRVRDAVVDGTGGPDGYRATVTALLSAWRISDARVFAAVSGNTAAATLDSLAVDALHGTLHGGGFVRWAPAFSWRARVAGDTLRVGDVAPTPDDWLGAVSFRARGTGTHAADSTRVAVNLDALDGTLRHLPLSAHARVVVENRLVRASDTEIRWGRARAKLSGTLDTAANATLDVSVPALAEILPRATGSASVSGRVTGTSTAADVRVAVHTQHARVESHVIPDLDATIDARVHGTDAYAPEAVEIRSADIRADDGSLRASGRVVWTPAVAWNLDLTSDRFEVSLVTPPHWKLRGPISLRARTQGRYAGRRTNGSLALESLDGMLRGRALSGHGRVSMRDGAADISDLSLTWGDANLLADGHVGEPCDLTVRAHVPDISWIVPDARGVLGVDGTFRGDLAHPAVDATIVADSIVVGGYGVTHVDAVIAADLASAAPGRVRVSAAGIVFGETAIDSARIGLGGTRHDHRIDITVSRPGARLDIDAHGDYSDDAWRGLIDSLRVREARVGTWRARGRSPLHLSRSAAELDSLRLVSGDATIDAHATWVRDDTAHVFVALQRFPMAGFAAYLPAGARVTGTLDGTATMTIDAGGRITGRAALIPGPGTVSVAGVSSDYDGNIRALADSSGVSATGTMALRHGTVELATLDAAVEIAGFVAGRDSLGAQPLSGHLNADCADIAPVLALVAPGYTHAAGTLTARLTAHGQASDFRLSGNADLKNARVDVPESGIRIRKASVSVVADGSGNTTLNGEATSGGGRIVLRAESARSGNGLIQGSFSITGERFLIMDEPEVQMFVSPDVDVTVVDRAAKITGDVAVPFARIEIPEIPLSAVGPSRDVVLVEDTLATRSPFEATTSVRVTLGDSVTFRGLGLRARLAGSVLVDDRTGHPTMGTGEIQLMDGKYRAYGNDLTIDRGRFVFGGGPIDNPGLDVSATRSLDSQQNVMTASGQQVGVKVGGTLKRPEITLFSNPPMQESEILSYLIFGRPLDTGSSGDQTALANAAILFGMYQGNQMAEGFGKELRLDEAHIESGSSSREASFVAGKYLSPELFVSYVAGLFGNADYFRVRYSLSSHWTLQGESGSRSGGDILYRFERGQ
jgi:translocation and assembly module TamB